MSYGLTTFAIALMFSTLVPYVPVFAMGFFMFKYYVDKYNLSFVYNSEFRGTGVIRKKVIPLSIFNIITVQIVNVGFFASKCGKNYLWFGMVMIFTEILAIIVYYAHSKRSHFLRHKKKRREQYHMSVARSTLHQTLKIFDSDDKEDIPQQKINSSDYYNSKDNPRKELFEEAKKAGEE